MDRIGRELHAVIAQRPEAAELGEALSRFLGSLVPHDALRLHCANPAQGLNVGALSVWHGYEPGLGQELLLSHHRGEDPCSPARLANAELPAAWVDADYPVFRAHGVGCELRVLLRDARGVWGLLGLLRAEGAGPFRQADARRLTGAIPLLISLVRTLVTSHPLAPPTAAPLAGVIILDGRHRTKAITPAARQWIDLLAAPGRFGPPPWTAEPFNVGMSLAVRRGGATPLFCFPPISFGRWVTVQGQPLDGEVAIVIQAAGLAALRAFGEWFGMTGRECAITEELCTGAAPKQIARRLEVSLHTVNSHLRSIYRKTGADGRDELLAAFGS
ncbi:helix-turn-helix transcriptional regulator [Pseudonocardiaceae bacterium YIM PH 21723]|nr:helix-turn-helix transcriptional regulator [Pseudonocardiaceae bacterium YIM PH 21723]